ncbi:MAG: sigma-70 family RNA polymerase sigma factor [Asticcacaulis sp.]|uniref:sigma-70 family RNA polymerase sigma factor n=1 Tax=Asticcacaulis sp. TaxID=1872648 RepID=UPI0039E39A72
MTSNLPIEALTHMTFDRADIIGSCGRMTDPHAATVSSAMVPSPEELIVRIADQRDRSAYATLFMQFAPRLKAFVMGLGLTAQEAEDLAQDTLLTVWRKADLFNPQKARASTWIYSIARNLRIDLARKAKRIRDLPEDLWQPEAEKTGDQALIDGEDSGSVKAILKILPPEQLAILKLSFYEDLSHADIARNLSLPLGTVKSRLRLAMERLRSTLKQTGGVA